MKTALLFLIIFSASPAYSEVISEDYCFSSGGPAPTRFELRTYHDISSKWSGAFVKYEKSKVPLSLIFQSTKVEGRNEDQPVLSTDEWLEVSGNKISGQYEIMSQGATVYSMTYTNNSTHKKLYFNLDPNVVPSVEIGCKW
jgi:hypothetical protein